MQRQRKKQNNFTAYISNVYSPTTRDKLMLELNGFCNRQFKCSIIDFIERDKFNVDAYLYASTNAKYHLKRLHENHLNSSH